MPPSLMQRLIDAPLSRLAVALGTRIERRRAAIDRALLPDFGSAGPGLVIQSPFDIRHPERIRFGQDVRIGPNSVLKMVAEYPRGWLRHPDGDHVEHAFDPHLVMGDRVTATAALRIVVYDRVTIEDDVTLAANVYISDGRHALKRGDRPYKFQGIESVKPIRVGRGAWIGVNSVILPGVQIGEFAVVGANSVVTADVPPGTIVIGAPARAVRRWDADSDAWQAVGVVGSDFDGIAGGG